MIVTSVRIRQLHFQGASKKATQSPEVFVQHVTAKQPTKNHQSITICTR